MTTQECYDRCLQDWSQYSVLADVLCELVSPYHLSSQLPHGWSNTILHHDLATLVVHYFFFIVIGLPTPVPATYTRAMDPERSGF
ncbi:hypothetical protein HETIRDRAFT_330357 [Heterobasidion irregulare TC 32-1]|uniref:Uncharacterized protein n=1 Tax=Heterobasidion irregulare (strain TC 32-1) TaxID=747525 RepID=W4JT64_HETIT|nr:uncharacterized protein HETIRDRAFT_330357 [Heterobasidion irregulare TC 32-1]ETW76076.1 hypothetical protein HETIRDRAFT_330357 [Heterobasidion irregulare TC 32-1]